MPNRLFHYKHFVEAHLIALLSEGKVKLSRPDKLNDPWDCRVHYQFPTDSEGRERLLNWLTEMNRKHKPSISEAQRTLIAQDFRSNPLKFEAAFVQNEEKMYRALSDQYRVYCLSERSDAPLMWSHYAKSHTGVCLEFDALAAPFTRESAATKVEYNAAYPAYDIVTVDYRPLVTKSSDWSYESEWRLIAEERAFAQSPDTLKTDDDFLILPSGVLKSVTIGCLADEVSRQCIDYLVKTHAPDVLVRQAAPAADRYDLIISPPFW